MEMERTVRQAFKNSQFLLNNNWEQMPINVILEMIHSYSQQLG